MEHTVFASSPTAEAPPSGPTGLPVIGPAAPKSAWVPLAALAVFTVVLGYLYVESLGFLVHAWLEDDNYSHGPFIPLISIVLIWLRWGWLQSLERRGQWWGLPVIATGLCVYVVGQFAAMHAVVHLSFWIVCVGLLTCVLGLSGTRLLGFPLAYLLAAIPPPEFLHGELSSRLQLWSSALGVGCLQLIGVMAYREGNVIDLGPIQLQVVEACSGLRYLFPLTALALLCAYLYREALWKRLVVFLSSIPISILLNGFRIGAIGVLVEAYGQSAAEGFSHFFEGWVLFLASLSLLFFEMWILARVGSNPSRRALADLIAPPRGTRREPAAEGAVRPASLPAGHASLFAGGLMLILASMAAPTGAPDELRTPERHALLDFPMQLGDWRGVPSNLERQYLDALQLDDYLLADYSDVDRVPVNLYVAYYGSPKKGRSSHSPRQCIPGGGWEITSFGTVRLDHGSSSSDVNRVMIQKSGHKQIVYYWFKQRDRLITSEYAVKFFLFWDALTRGRADGALVRLVSEVRAGETDIIAEGRLQSVAVLVAPLLARYVPD